MLLLFSVRVAYDHLYGKKVFIRCTVHASRELFSICVFFFPFWFCGWDVRFDCTTSLS